MDKYRLIGERRPGEEAAAAAAAAASSKGESKPPAVDTPAQQAPASGANAGEQAASAEGEGGGGGGGSSSSDPNEIRITQQGKPRNYISYAIGLFDQEGNDSITLKAMGRAINKCVTITEILKRKMPLHQITKLSSEEIIDVFEPLEEGLDVVESKRYVSCMVVTLSKTGKGMDTSDIGYQAPLPIEDIQPGDFNRATFERSETPTAAGGKGGGGGEGLPPTDSTTTVMAR
mmetsp:Transcript_6061/g.16981  ORF Transcript_6061/g.16981 Transcript_6061/m.16981 type:complete len:231 (-) Transcript_6061:54-746(-)